MSRQIRSTILTELAPRPRSKSKKRIHLCCESHAAALSHLKRFSACGRRITSFAPKTGDRISGTYVDAYPRGSKPRTVQIIGYHFEKLQDFEDALLIAAKAASPTVERLELVGCLYVNDALLRKIPKLFPSLKVSSVFNCPQMGLAWLVSATATAFDDLLPIVVAMAFAEPSQDMGVVGARYTSVLCKDTWSTQNMLNGFLQWLVEQKGDSIASVQPSVQWHIFLRCNQQARLLTEPMHLLEANTPKKRSDWVQLHLVRGALNGDADAKRQLRESSLRRQTDTEKKTVNVKGNDIISNEKKLPCGSCDLDSDDDHIQHIQVHFPSNTRTEIKRLPDEEVPDHLSCYLGLMKRGVNTFDGRVEDVACRRVCVSKRLRVECRAANLQQHRVLSNGGDNAALSDGLTCKVFGHT